MVLGIEHTVFILLRTHAKQMLPNLHKFIDWFQTKDLNLCPLPLSWRSTVHSIKSYRYIADEGSICARRIVVVGCDHTLLEWIGTFHYTYGILHTELDRENPDSLYRHV